MEYLKLKDEVIKLHLLKIEELKIRKNNINSNYTSALQDIRVIKNIEDTIETLQNIISELNDLQERIQNRNNGKL